MTDIHPDEAAPLASGVPWTPTMLAMLQCLRDYYYACSNQALDNGSAGAFREWTRRAEQITKVIRTAHEVEDRERKEAQREALARLDPDLPRCLVNEKYEGE